MRTIAPQLPLVAAAGNGAQSGGKPSFAGCSIMDLSALVAVAGERVSMRFPDAQAVLDPSRSKEVATAEIVDG